LYWRTGGEHRSACHRSVIETCGRFRGAARHGTARRRRTTPQDQLNTPVHWARWTVRQQLTLRRHQARPKPRLGSLCMRCPAHSCRSKLAARASCCRTPLQAFYKHLLNICSSFSSRATQSASICSCSASICSCPSSERKRSRHAAKLVCPTCDCGAHQQLVDPLDARVGILHPRDERSSHLEFTSSSAIESDTSRG
jgi:hypothetical protein